MTMPNSSHPDDERLAAYAGGDADATSDRALAAHLSSCDRCAPIVDELALLRGALAALPDLAPSRPLRLIPPVPAAAPRPAGPLAWLRRLAAPAMAAGAGLALVGAVGLSGAIAGFSWSGADRSAMEGSFASDNAAAPGLSAESPQPAPQSNPEFGSAQSPRSLTDGASASELPGSRGEVEKSASPAASGPAPSPEEGENVGALNASRGEEPWLTILIAGTALFTIATLLRFSLTPRAG